MTIGERIKKLRKALDLTQQEFGEKIGSTQNAIGNYETGHRNPSSSVINNICKTFNVHEPWLRTGDGDMLVRTLNTALEQLSVDFYLDAFDEALVEEYLHLTPNQRKTFRTFFFRVLKKSIGDSTPEELLKTEMGYPEAGEIEALADSANRLVSSPSSEAQAEKEQRPTLQAAARDDGSIQVENRSLKLHMAAKDGSRPEPEMTPDLKIPGGNQFQKMQDQDKERIGDTPPAPEET